MGEALGSALLARMIPDRVRADLDASRYEGHADAIGPTLSGQFPRSSGPGAVQNPRHRLGTRGVMPTSATPLRVFGCPEIPQTVSVRSLAIRLVGLHE